MTWGKEYVKFTVEECGFKRSAVDRHLFNLKAPSGVLLVLIGAHMGDSITLVLNEEVFRKFGAKWIAAFGGEPDRGERLAAVPFLGLPDRPVDESTTEITDPRLFDELERAQRRGHPWWLRRHRMGRWTSC